MASAGKRVARQPNKRAWTRKRQLNSQNSSIITCRLKYQEKVICLSFCHAQISRTRSTRHWHFWSVWLGSGSKTVLGVTSYLTKNTNVSVVMSQKELVKLQPPRRMCAQAFATWNCLQNSFSYKRIKPNVTQLFQLFSKKFGHARCFWRN